VKELAVYLVAGAVYVVLGVAIPELLFSWIEGAVFLLLAVWVLPAVLERFR
jgi:putative Ca2+/H+ antiporter (TMEM165/GDT1 family)